MKGFLHKLELPSFIKDSRLIASSIILLGLLLASAIIGFLISPWYGLAQFLIFVLATILVVYGAYIIAAVTNDFVSNLSYRIKRGEQEAMIQMPMGIMLYDENYRIQWINPYLQLYIKDTDVIGKTISDVTPELNGWIAKAVKEKNTENMVIDLGEHKFEMSVQNDLGVVYLLDVTRYAKYEERYQSERLAIGQIFIDNYDELSQSMGDQSVSNMSNYLQEALNYYMNSFNAYLKRVDDDHFLMLAHLQDLEQMEKDKFSILDSLRTESSRRNIPLTLSIGIGYGSDKLTDISDLAQSNLDLALGRGGDQVVVREAGKQARFYGGKSNPMEKRTRVRARMVSHALSELFKDADHVFVMGHQRPDLDAVGSGLGIVKIARLHGAQAHFVLNEDRLNFDVARLVDRLNKHGEEDLFISSSDANSAATNKSLLVLVDHSKSSITYDKDLYDRLKDRLIVVDHHRRGEEFPENPMLVYIEPYASSTCELVTELVEYQPQNDKLLTSTEASGMLAGITVDSKEFSLRTGTRTFDAASYLRSIGADSNVVSSFLKEDINSFVQRSHLVATLQTVKPGIALIMGNDDQIYDPIIAAQAADTALSLENVGASFAVTRRSKDVVGISARSLGEINVQLIMEKLGGGGHLSNAASQLKDVTVDQAKDKLLQALDEYLADEED
ncbi:MAG: DHH family phosphoesterase [Lactobacillus sp.]